jgi:hypothetical protein
MLLYIGLIFHLKGKSQTNVLENRTLRRTFGPYKDMLTGIRQKVIRSFIIYKPTFHQLPLYNQMKGNEIVRIGRMHGGFEKFIQFVGGIM